MRIAIITGSRGDRSALEEVYRALSNETVVQELPQHSVRWIDVEPGISVRSRTDAASVAGIACSTVAGDLAGMPTDLVMVLGDRHEIVGAALGANIMGVPIAHLSGGDITEGSQDDSFRHAVTKLSHLHFPTNNEAAFRLIQMGEQPDTVHVAGWPCLDRLARTPLPNREETFALYGLPLDRPSLLVSLHPDTLGDTRLLLKALSEALWAVSDRVSMVLVGPNHDPDNEMIREAWASMASTSTKIVYKESLAQEDFWALMSHCDVLVGNSSCGYYEAPSMAIPVVDIGDRQKGRIPSSLLYNAEVDAADIMVTLDAILSGEAHPRIPVENPYGDGKACERIIKVLDGVAFPKALLRKVWREAMVREWTEEEAMFPLHDE